MPKVTTYIEMTDEQAISLLRNYIANMPPKEPPRSEFKIGDAVRLDNGCLGVLYEFDDEGNEVVIHFDEEGRIKGPSYGWRLTKL